MPRHLRGQGVGASLTQTAETIAIDRGAKHSCLTTFEFQARGFYEKYRYRVVGALVGYPPGTAYYWMRKDLVEDRGQDE